MSKRQIGKLKETSLHASLKEIYAVYGSETEKEIEGYIVDVVRDDYLIEIQTGNFSKINRKFQSLLEEYKLRLVYPIAETRYIVRVDHLTGEILNRRKSPKRGQILDVFKELIYIPKLVKHHNFSLDILFLDDEIIYLNDGKGSWRRQHWSILDRRILEVNSCRTIFKPGDLINVLPQHLQNEFTTSDIVKLCGVKINLAQKTLYCLHRLGLIERIGKNGNTWLYKISD